MIQIGSNFLSWYVTAQKVRILVQNIWSWFWSLHECCRWLCKPGCFEARRGRYLLPTTTAATKICFLNLNYTPHHLQILISTIKATPKTATKLDLWQLIQFLNQWVHFIFVFAFDILINLSMPNAFKANSIDYRSFLDFLIIIIVYIKL